MFAGKKSAQIREILISESAWEEMTCLFAPSLNNNRIVKTFADNADEADINATLPGFYRTPGRELSLMIDEYRGAWIFAASNVPSLYCRKNAP